ncbi:MAG TPA: shikimate kinase, partial [Gaiellaceae bacterium]|nr:shikimate kinase [Gaiellaceae bacterium]
MGAPLTRHIALVGFMAAGKSTLGAQAAERTGFAFHDLDESLEHAVGDIATFFRDHGEAAFRELEESETLWSLVESPPSVIALGGGAVTSTAVREGLRVRAITVWVDLDVDTCWQRARDSGRPLAQDETEFRRLYEERRPLYAAAA